MKRHPLLAALCALLALWAMALSASLPSAPAAHAQDASARLVAQSADKPRLDLPTPDPALAPADVVRLQLEALAQNDQPYADAGIETAYNFASPSNRSVSGDFARFVEMVKNPVYRDLIGSQHVRYGRMQVEGDVARQAVVLVTADAFRVGYVFTLVRQASGACDGCWLSESVVRFEVRDEEPLAYSAQPVVST